MDSASSGAEVTSVPLGKRRSKPGPSVETLNAIDLHTGAILWKVPLGDYPELVAKGIRNTGAKNFGGPQAWMVHLNGLHSYTVENGAIVGRTVPGSPNSFLCPQQEFDDFELELDVMVDSVTNSGIQIRSRVKPVTVGEGHDMRAGRVYGSQVEMQRNHRPGTPTTGLIYREALGTGWLSAKEKIQNGHHHL